MRSLLKKLIPASLSCAALVTAHAGANPNLPFWGGGGTITATPHYPLIGENAHFDVVVSNGGDAPATNVEVKLSYNDWGITFMGWQEIGAVTIPSIPPGGSVTVQYEHVFENRAHTCIEALIVSADENTDPNDDRGQINLEVINTGETFSWDVPIRNNGDEPIHMAVQGHCLKNDTANGRIPCKDVLAEVVVQPGEEVLVPVQVDLRDLPPGQIVDFFLEAFDVNAGPANAAAERNHVHLKIVRSTALRLVKKSLLAAQGAHGSVDSKTARRLEIAIKQLEHALKPQLWLNENDVNKAGGAQVFAHDADTAKILIGLLQDDLPIGVKTALDAAARELSDAMRIVADTALRQVGGDASALNAGDAARAQGDYSQAINAYKHVWLGAK